MAYKSQKDNVIMLCTAGRGGMRTVVESYRDDGLFDKWNVKLIFTHDDGSVMTKLFMFIKALLIFVYYLLFTRVALIHNHSAMKGSFWRKNVFSFLARLRGIPVLLHLHGSEMEKFYKNESAGGKRMISSILTKADAVIVLSKSWSEFIGEVAPRANVEVVYNYVRLPDKSAVSLNDGVVRILFLGLLGKRKGIYDLIEVAKRLKEKNKKIEFWIGGNGEVNQVQKLIDQYQIGECFKLLGWVDKGSKEQYLSKADVYILPSYNEGLPMSVLEAMSWQIPVISTNVGGIPELIREEVDGFIVEPGNIDQIELSLTKLIDSESLRNDMGKNSKERIRDVFSDEVILPKLDSLYQKVGNWSSQ